MIMFFIFCLAFDGSLFTRFGLFVRFSILAVVRLFVNQMIIRYYDYHEIAKLLLQGRKINAWLPFFTFVMNRTMKVVMIILLFHFQ